MGQRLHDEHGAKKFLVINVGRIGCSPYSRARSATARGGGCAEEVNDATLLFDRELKSEMERLNRNKLYAKANFMFVNTTTNIDTDPTSLGTSSRFLSLSLSQFHILDYKLNQKVDLFQVSLLPILLAAQRCKMRRVFRMEHPAAIDMNTRFTIHSIQHHLSTT